MTKDLVPSLVIPDGTPWPWSAISLLLAPLSFVVAARMSDRTPDSPVPWVLFIVVAAIMLVFLVRDSLGACCSPDFLHPPCLAAQQAGGGGQLASV